MTSASLPALREELRLLPATSNSDGSPAWMIQDPVINRFYRIGWLDFELLCRWSMSSNSMVVNDVNRANTLCADEEDMEALIAFRGKTVCCWPTMLAQLML